MRNGALAALVLGSVLAVGMIGGGFMIGRLLFAARAADRCVTGVVTTFQYFLED